MEKTMFKSKEDSLSTEVWVKAIKGNAHLAWIIAEAIAVTNLSMEEEIIGYGIYPAPQGEPWALTNQDRLSHSLSLIRISYELFLPNEEFQGDESYSRFAEAYEMLFNPLNHIPGRLN